MTISSGSMLAAVAAAAAVTMALSDGARAACPETPCDCVGGAAAYRVVADRLFDFGSTFYGHLCTRTAQLAEPTDYGQPDDIVGDLHALAGAGSVAVRGRIARQGPGDEIVVSGTLATGGGDVTGPVSAGTLDTTGTHPGITACDQAEDDIVAGSQMLAALTPTQTLPRLIIDQPGLTQFPVGPGVNVIQVDGRIAMRQGILEIVLDPGTDAVVFNARAFSMRRSTRIFVSGGDATKVMINLPGPGPSVVAKSDAWITPPVLAPERTMRIKGGTRFAALFGRRVIVHQSVTDFDTCSPSGAFLEAPDPF